MERSFKQRHSPSGDSMVIGRQPVVEALLSGRPIDKILFQKGVSGESIGEIRKLAGERNVPIQQVPPEKLHHMTRSNHQGVIALAGMVTYHDLQQVIDWIVGEGKIPLLVMLDGVTDVRNIGSIARTAFCCGAQALIIPDKGVGALNEDAVKASAGALQHIHVCRVNSLMKAVDTLHLNGLLVYGAAMEGARPLFELDWKVPACIIMGSEDRGIYPPLLKITDERVCIPMQASFDSLNVGVAAGILLYEAMKQRLH